MNACEEALFTVELDRLPVRFTERRYIEPGQLGTAHYADLRARRHGEADSHVGADQESAREGRGVFRFQLSEQNAGAHREEVGGQGLIVDRVLRRAPER